MSFESNLVEIQGIIFCSILNNTATSQQCIYLNNGNNVPCTHEIKNCNIIENEANNIIHSQGETNIYFSLFMNNLSPYFSVENSNSKFILCFCCIDNPAQIESSAISQNENQITDSSILSLPYLKTGFCDISFHYCHCTENSFLQNLYLHKIIIPSPFIFLLLSNTF